MLYSTAKEIQLSCANQQIKHSFLFYCCVHSADKVKGTKQKLWSQRHTVHFRKLSEKFFLAHTLQSKTAAVKKRHYYYYYHLEMSGVTETHTS